MDEKLTFGFKFFLSLWGQLSNNRIVEKLLPQVVGADNTQKLSNFGKIHFCEKRSPQVVAIETPEKTTP